MFSYKDCRFKVEPYKLGTGRVVAWKQFSITHSFTLESSFYGYDFGEDQHKLFGSKEYQEVGSKLCQSIFDLHFLWKSIRNELKLTNGWLKPRKLIEMTGVPAAQLLNEELLKKKKEDQKRRAIEIYEQFLKKFYNKQDLQSIQNQRRTSKNFQLLPIQQFQFKQDQPLPQPQQQQQVKNQKQSNTYGANTQPNNNKTTLEKSRNRGEYPQQDSSFYQNSQQPALGNSDTPDFNDMDQIYKLLQGLVKIQARVRGFLIRKRFKMMIPRIRIKKHSKKGSITEGITLPKEVQYDPNQPIEGGVVTLKHQLQPNGQNQNMLGNSIDDMIDSINWRQYFQEQELEEAYHVVEIEKQDDPEDEFSDGSSSNPSIDNFDLRDIYEKIYEINNAEEIQQLKNEANLRFLNEINDQEFVDQQKLMELIDDAFSLKKRQNARSSLGKSGGNKYLKQSSTIRPSKNMKGDLINSKGQQINIISLNQQQQQTPEQAHLLNPQCNCCRHEHGSNSMKNQKYIRRSPYHPQQFYSTGLNIEQQILKKSNTQSPIQKDDDPSSYPLTTHSIFDQNKINRNAISQGKDQVHLNYSTYGHKFNTQAGINSQQMNQISQMHIKLFQQSQINNYGKKESIQQVIKDCFITKKIVNPDSKFTSPSPQKQKANRTFYQHVDGQRMHSFNNFKNLAAVNQPVNTLQYLKKPKKSPISSNNVVGTVNNFRSPLIQPSSKQEIMGSRGSAPYQNNSASNQNIKDKLLNEDQNENDYSDYQLQNDHFATGINGSQGNINGSGVQDSASSLFMRYVKSKLVKKIKTEQLPQQVANKYMDIYKELIDKEAQRKQEDQEFLRQRQQQNQTYAVGTQQNSAGVVMNSRNKQQARSEQKSRHRGHKNRQTREQIQFFEDSVLINQKQIKVQGINGIERKSMEEQQYSAGAHSNNTNLPYSIMINGASNYTAANHFSKKHANRSVYLQQDATNNLTSTTDDTYQISTQLVAEDATNGGKVRFPIINNFSSTLDYKKNSREAMIALENQQKAKAGVEQAYNLNGNQYQQQQLAKSKVSNDSSIDDEMLDKIKNIYSEMRGVPVPSMKTNLGTGQQFYTQQQVSTNSRGVTKMSSLRQKRLMMKGAGAQVEPLIENYQSGPKTEARQVKLPAAYPPQQVNGAPGQQQQIAKSVSQSMNPPQFSERR